MVLEKRKINSKIIYSIINNYKFLFIIILFFFIGFADKVEAATMYLSPASGNKKVGTSFSVSVYVNSSGEASNAYSGRISFPTNKLQVVSVSRAGSVISSWVQEPSFSNSSGSVSFEGVVFNPGYSGSGGKIVTITFKVKSAGKGVLSFSNGSILANDGLGTSILSGLGSASFDFSDVVEEPVKPKVEKPKEEKKPEVKIEIKPPIAPVVVALLSPPTIISSNFPDQNKWYAVNNPKFEWIMPNGVNDVDLSITREPVFTADSTTNGVINKYEYNNFEDGFWNFHVRLKNSAGWSEVSNYHFQIDTKPPDNLRINFISGKETDSPEVKIGFEASDVTSGIEYYYVKIDNYEPTTTTANFYVTPLLGIGKHNVVVKAYDRAGNYSSIIDEFTVKPLNPPQFVEYPTELNKGDFLIIKGKTYPSAQVTVWLQKNSVSINSQTIRSNESGIFTFVWSEKVEAGFYKVWADVTDSRMLRSGPSDIITIAVQQSAFWKITSIINNYLAAIIPLLALLLLAIYFLVHIGRKLAMLKKKDSCCVCLSLLDDMRSNLKTLESASQYRQLTKEENEIYIKLKKDLADTDGIKKIIGYSGEVKK